VLGTRAGGPVSAADALDLDPGSDEARRLVSHGLAERVADSIALVHPQMAAIVTRSADQLSYVQMILRVVESTDGTIDDLAATLVAALEESIAARFGAGYVPTTDEMDEVAALIRDYRDLGLAVVSHQLDKAMQSHMVSAASDYTIGMVTRGDWKPAGA
jgi:hypothetical protein